MTHPTLTQLRGAAWWDKEAPGAATHVELLSGGQYRFWKDDGGPGTYSWHKRFSEWQLEVWPHDHPSMYARPKEMINLRELRDETAEQSDFAQVGDRVRLKDALCVDDDERLKGQPLTVLARFTDSEGEAYVAFEYTGKWVDRVDIAQVDNLEPYEDSNRQALEDIVGAAQSHGFTAGGIVKMILDKFDVTPRGE